MALPSIGLRISRGVRLMRRDYGIYAGSRDAKLRHEAKTGINSQHASGSKKQDYVDVDPKTMNVNPWTKKMAVGILTVLVIFIMIGIISVMATR